MMVGYGKTASRLGLVRWTIVDYGKTASRLGLVRWTIVGGSWWKYNDGDTMHIYTSKL